MIDWSKPKTIKSTSRKFFCTFSIISISKISKGVKIVYSNFQFFILALLGSLEETTEESNPEEEEVNVQDMLKLDPDRIKSVTFPNYVDPNVKDDMVIFFS